MKRSLLAVLPLLVAGSLAALGTAAAREDAKTTLKIEDLAWLEGRWRSSEGGETFDEVWLPPEGDSMAAVSREVQGGKTSMFELSSIEQHEGGVVLRIRHFGAGLAPWKSEAAGTPTWKLVRSGEREAVFEDAARDFPKRIAYRRETAKDGDVLVARLEGEQQGHPTEMEFRLARVAAAR